MANSVAVMRLRLTLIAAVSASLVAGAGLARPRVGEVIAGGCRQGQCAWLRILATPPPRPFPEGVLRAITVRRGFSTHLDGSVPRRPPLARIDWDTVSRDNLVFCSTRRPAFGFEGEQGLIVHFLDLYDLAGYQMSSADLYMRLCHQRPGLPRAALLRRLGYRPGTRNEQVENATVATMTRF